MTEDVLSWTVGDVTVTLARELVAHMPVEVMYSNSDPAVFAAHADWLAPHVDDQGTLPMSVHSYVVRADDQLILVDTGAGSHHVDAYPVLSDLDDTLMRNLALAGVSPGDVDLVVCTHLHVDHVGWNTSVVDGQRVPTFPNARYLFTRADYEHWDRGALGAAFTFADAVKPIVQAGLADFVEMDLRISDSVRLQPAPGHSPGHVSVRISSQGREAVITGDLMHHPVQIAAPTWHMTLDHDAELAVETRLAFLKEHADSSTRIFGSHFPGTSSGHVLTRDGGYVLVAD